MEIAISEVIALYAAILSTVIALVSAANWLMRKPRLRVIVHNPDDCRGGDMIFGFIIVNIGSEPTAVEKVIVSFFTRRLVARRQIAKDAIFNQKSNWNPAVQDDTTSFNEYNASKKPKVLLKGDEIHKRGKLPEKFDPTMHWIRVTAIPRNCRSAYSGWAGPVKSEKGDI